MALPRQMVEIPLSGGIDTSSDERQQTSCIMLSNCQYDQTGRLVKRKGLVEFSYYDSSENANTLRLTENDAATKCIMCSDTKGIGVHDGALYAIGNQSDQVTNAGDINSEDTDILATYDSGMDYWKKAGNISVHDIDYYNLAHYSNYSYHDMAVWKTNSKLSFTAMTRFESGHNYITIKSNSGSILLRDQEILTGASAAITTRCSVFAFDNKFLVVAFNASGSIHWIEYTANASYTKFTRTNYTVSLTNLTAEPVAFNVFTHSTDGECLVVFGTNSTTTPKAFVVNTSRTVLYNASVTSYSAASTTVARSVCTVTKGDGSQLLAFTQLRLVVASGVYTVSHQVLTESLAAAYSHHATLTGFTPPSANHTYANVRITTIEDPYGTHTSGRTLYVISLSPAYEEVYQASVSPHLSGGALAHSSVVMAAGVNSDTTAAVNTTYLTQYGVSCISNLAKKDNKAFALFHYNINGHETLTATVDYGVNTLFQPTSFLCSLARSTTDYSTYNYYLHPEAIIYPRRGVYEAGYKDLGKLYVDTDNIQFLGVRQHDEDSKHMAFSCSYIVVDTSNSPASAQSATAQGVTMLPGSVPARYDGSTACEHNFLVPPVITMGLVADDATSAIDYNRYCRYKAVYQLANERGEIEESVTSNDYYIHNTEFLGAAASGYVAQTINIAVPPIGQYDKLVNRKAVVKLYRTETSATTDMPPEPFYYINSVAITYAPTNGIVQIIDKTDDADLLSREILYTTGGVIDTVNTPALKGVFSHDNRMIGISAEDRNELWPSKIKSAGTGFGFCEEFTIRVEDAYPITAGFSMDSSMVVFTERNIYRILGGGPDDLGNGAYSAPMRIVSGIGCKDGAPIAECELGVVFQSSSGLHLLTRSFEVQYIGKQVEKYKDFTLGGIQVLTDAKQIRFILKDCDETLVWHYDQGAWTVFGGMYFGTLGTVWDNTPVILNKQHGHYGLFKQSTTAYQDWYVSSDCPYSMSILTPWVKAGGLQTEGRVYWFYLLGELLERNQGIKIDIYYDYSDIVQQTIYLNGNTLALPYRFKPDRERFVSIRLRVSDYLQSSNFQLGNTMNLSSVGIECAAKGSNKLYAKQSSPLDLDVYGGFTKHYILKWKPGTTQYDMTTAADKLWRNGIYPATTYGNYSIVVFNDSDMWAFGDTYVSVAHCAHWDGASWRQYGITGSAQIWASVGFARDNIWALDDAGRALHWNGRTWSIETLPFSFTGASHPNCIGGIDGDDIWAACVDQGSGDVKIFRRQNEAWTLVDTLTGAAVTSMSIDTPGNVLVFKRDNIWFACGTVFSWDGSSITDHTASMAIPGHGTSFNVNAIAGLKDSSMYVVTASSPSYVYHYDGAWTDVTSSIRSQIPDFDEAYTVLMPSEDQLIIGGVDVMYYKVNGRWRKLYPTNRVGDSILTNRCLTMKSGG